MKTRTVFIIIIIINNIAFAQCPTPIGLYTNNITHFNALANWTPVLGVDHYKIRYKTYGSTGNWSNLGNINANDSTRNIPLLQQGTCYEWQIIAYCDSTNQQSSSWSITDTFTTYLFVPETFNPIINNSIANTQCNQKTTLSLRVTQTANEPDIDSSYIYSSAGEFDLSSVASGDSVGYAIINTSTQTIKTTLKIGLILSQNYAIINSIDSTGNIIGFFTIENISGGVEIKSTSPNDGNNYTSGFNSEVYFTNLFVNPNINGELYFYSYIKSELNDVIYKTDTFMITCVNEIKNNPTIQKKLINTYTLRGSKTKRKNNQILLYQFSDGTIEKKIKIDR